jgi:hypothetical protein
MLFGEGFTALTAAEPLKAIAMLSKALTFDLAYRAVHL